MSCIDCNRPMRKRRETLVDKPGTVSYGSHGLCQGCYRKAGPAAAKKAAAAITAAPGNRASLEAYLRARRPYRLKAGTA